MYLLSGPTGHDAKCKMQDMLVDVIVKEAIANRDRNLAAYYVDPDGKTFDELDAATQEKIKGETPIALTFDGEKTFLDAGMRFASTRTDLANQLYMIKHPAACSAFQQPLDVSPCFKKLKAALAKELAADDGVREQPFNRKVEVQLDLVPAASRRIFLRWLSLMPDLISNCMTMGDVKKGWEKSGLCPYDMMKILSVCTAWAELTEEDRIACIVAVNRLAPRVLENGEVTDKETKAVLGEVADVSALDNAKYEIKDSKPCVDNYVLNRRRSLIVSHPKVMAREFARQAAAKAPSPAAKVRFVNVCEK